MKRADSMRQGSARPRPDPPARKLPNRLLRYFLNIWVALHFTAIVAAAGTIGPSADYLRGVWYVFHPYLQFLFLNHGFNFYAPEPAPSNLLKFEAFRADGSVVKGQIPERLMRPRLLYQRHLLLTEHIGVAPPDSVDRWFESYAHHICRKYGATHVHLTHVLHGFLPMEMVQNGGRLDDPVTYSETDLGDFSCDKP
jgi:hypothetical protein